MSNLDANRSLYKGFSNLVESKHFTTISVEVVFGAPSIHCLGAGICQVLNVERVRVRWKCPSARAWLSLTPEGGLRLTFDRNQFLPGIFERYFRDQKFQVDEAYSLPKSLSSLLNLEHYTVEPGQYVVEVSAQFLTVDF